MSDDHDETRVALSTALGHMVTRYVVIAETIDRETGESQILNAHSPGLLIWDAIGLVGYARRHYDRMVGCGHCPDEDEDE